MSSKEFSTQHFSLCVCVCVCVSVCLGLCVHLLQSPLLTHASWRFLNINITHEAVLQTYKHRGRPQEAINHSPVCVCVCVCVCGREKGQGISVCISVCVVCVCVWGGGG